MRTRTGVALAAAAAALLAALPATAQDADKPKDPGADTPKPAPDPEASKPAPAATDADKTKKEIEELKRAQKELIEKAQAQQKKIDELSKAAGLPPEPAGPEKPDNTAKWNELTAGPVKFKLYGMVRLDMIYDTARPNNPFTASFIRAEDRTAPAGVGNAPGKDDFLMHPRLTKIGVDLDGPEVEALGSAKTSGKIEIDFYSNGLLGQTESREAIRMRHAYVKLDWGLVNILAGQTSDLIAPFFPIVNPDFVMWNAGNLGDRRPQFRVEGLPPVGPGNLLLQAMVGLTGADSGTINDATGTGSAILDGIKSGRPTSQGRLGYRVKVWETKQTLEVGAWIHYAWNTTDTPIRGEHNFDSFAYGGDLLVPVYSDIVTIKLEIWQGRNLPDVRGGIGQGINTAIGRGIRSKGGFAELGVKPIKYVLLSVGYSRDDPDNGDLSVNNPCNNRIIYFSSRFYFDPVEFGIDYLYWATDYRRLHSGEDSRIQAYIGLKF